MCTSEHWKTALSIVLYCIVKWHGNKGKENHLCWHITTHAANTLETISEEVSDSHLEIASTIYVRIR